MLLKPSLMIIAIATVLLALPQVAVAQGESVAVAASSTVAQSLPATVTVQGVADGNHHLFVFVDPTGGTCSQDGAYHEQWAHSLSGASGDAVDAGAFSKSYTYTPPSAGTYTLCAYLSATLYDLSDAMATGRFAAVRPSGSITLSASANPVETLPTTITVSGSAQIARNLFVFVDPTGDTCSQDGAYHEQWAHSLSGASGDAVDAGAFSKSYTYTPPSAGTYTMCAYLSATLNDPSDAMATGTFRAWSGAILSAVSPPDGSRITSPPVTITYNISGPAHADHVYFARNPTDITSGVAAELATDGMLGAGERHTLTLPITKAGTYYWIVAGHDRDGVELTTGIQRLVVGPSAPTRLSATTRTRTPTWRKSGGATLRVVTNPWELVALTLTRRGKRLTSSHTRADQNGRVTWAPTIRCPLSGRFEITLRARDDSGHALVQQVAFHTSDCGPKPKPPHRPTAAGGDGGPSNGAPGPASSGPGTVPVPTVHPGAFCSPNGALGVTVAGTQMICGPASDGRDRWHQS
jgi:hypothetical protein